MGELLALQLAPPAIALLEEEAQRLGGRLRVLGAAAELAPALRGGGERAELLVVGSGEADPVAIAQQAFRAAARLPVLLLAEPGCLPALAQRLAITPFVSSEVRCLPAGDGEHLREAVRGAVQRARQGRHLRQVVAAANAQLAVAAAPHLPAPAAEVLDRLLQLAPVGVLATDLSGTVRACNARAAALLSVPQAQVVGQPLPDLLPEEARAELAEALSRATSGAGAPAAGTLHLPAPAAEDGGRLHVELSVVRLAGRGEQSGYLLVLQDATERARLLAELREAVRVRDEFVAVAAHELNTPLTALSLRLQRLRALGRRGPVGPGALDGEAAHLERGMRRLTRLVAELLDVSRITTGRLELRPEPVDLRRLAAGVLEQLAGSAAQAGCALQLSGPAHLEGWWDPLRVEQVLVNLVGNALKFGAGRPVDVELAALPDAASLAVRDRGPGIPPHEQQRIFERFERAVSTRHHGGLGLGLWITRQIARAHGGEVHVESAPGHGATFRVTLPLARRGAPGA